MGRSQSIQGGRWLNVGLGIYFGLILLFLYGPIIIMAVLSFQGPQGGMTFPLKGVSLHWWQRLFGERASELGAAIVRTLVVAVETGLIAAAFSLIIAFAYRRRLPGTRVLFPIVLLALMTPGILLGLGVSLWWRILNMQPGHLSLLGVHVVWALPFAFLVMLAVLNRFDPGIEESARDLGAGELRTFFEVVFPIIWPGVLSAALFGFTLSLNEFERSVLATSQNTLPLQLWAMLTVQIIEPDLYALGTLTTLVTFVIVGALFIPTILSQIRRFSRRRAE
jgi:putative spermidine/putrescine transport system permease protein